MKITLWFAGALVLMVALTYGVLLSVSHQVIQKTVRDGLIETVENNVDEIVAFGTAALRIATNGEYLLKEILRDSG